MEEEIISCIGTGYINPIISLCEKLTYDNFSKNSPMENGFSVSVIILSALTIESALNRIRYINNSKDNNLFFFREKLNNSNLYNKIIELFVMRDLIAHNHIWIKEKDTNGKFIPKEKLNGYGDKKYHNCINQKTNQTKILKLTVIPDEISVEEVAITLKLLEETLDFFHKKQLNYFPTIKNRTFKFGDEFLKLAEIIEKIEDTYKLKNFI